MDWNAWITVKKIMDGFIFIVYLTYSFHSFVLFTYLINFFLACATNVIPGHPYIFLYLYFIHLLMFHVSKNCMKTIGLLFVILVFPLCVVYFLCFQ